jgi:hypothetical protein
MFDEGRVVAQWVGTGRVTLFLGQAEIIEIVVSLHMFVAAI